MCSILANSYTHVQSFLVMCDLVTPLWWVLIFSHKEQKKFKKQPNLANNWPWLAKMPNFESPNYDFFTQS